MDMKRDTKMKILAVIALFAILFSIVSTAILIVFSSRNQAPQEIDLSDFITSTWTSDTLKDIEITDISATWTTN